VVSRNKVTPLSRLEEAGVYLSTYKLFEHKPPDLIKERVDKVPPPQWFRRAVSLTKSRQDYASVMRAALTSVRGINKTDVMTLRSNFGVGRAA
jgi:DNA excision repair protein ERCC-1